MSEKERRAEIEALDLNALVRAIVGHLSPTWSVEPDLGERVPSVCVSREDGAKWYVYRSLWPPALDIGGCWPRDERLGEFYPRDRGSISASPLRDPKALARDIERRFLAKFLPEWARQSAAMREAVAKSEEARRLAERLGKILLTEARHGSDGWTLYSSSCYVQVSRWQAVTFERLTLDPARATEVCMLLARFAAEDGAAS